MKIINLAIIDENLIFDIRFDLIFQLKLNFHLFKELILIKDQHDLYFFSSLKSSIQIKCNVEFSKILIKTGILFFYFKILPFINLYILFTKIFSIHHDFDFIFNWIFFIWICLRVKNLRKWIFSIWLKITQNYHLKARSYSIFL